MIILGICGPIGHGKTTLADYFSTLEPDSIHLESSGLIAKVADGLNGFYYATQPKANDLPSVNAWLAYLGPILLQSANYNLIEPIVLTSKLINSAPGDYQKLWEYLGACQKDPSLPRHKITSQNKSKYRSLLQWLGAYGQQHIDSGLWYNELVMHAKASNKQLAVIGGVRFKADAEIIQDAGGHIISIIRPDFTEQDANDATERFRKQIPVNVMLKNNGSLEQLQKTASLILKDIKSGSVSRSYSANQQK